MKIFLLTSIFILSFVKIGFGQFGISYETRKALELYNTSRIISGSSKSTLFDVDYTGSPYLNEEFVNGSIYSVHRIQYEEVPLRYNVYNDELEFKSPTDEILALANPDIVEKAVMGDTTLVYLPFLQANKAKKGFFIILEEGKVSLYAKPDVFLKPATQPGAYKDPEPPKFVRKSDEYYLKTETGQAVLIANKKELIAAFPDNQDKIESFISKNKIKSNKADGLKELVKYYNSIK